MSEHELDAWICNLKPAGPPEQANNSSSTSVVSGLSVPGAATHENKARAPRRPGVIIEEVEDKDNVHGRPTVPPEVVNIDVDQLCGGSTQHRPAKNSDGLPFQPDTLRLPFPLPKDYPRAREDMPNGNSPSTYLQIRCPICFAGPN